LAKLKSDGGFARQQLTEEAMDEIQKGRIKRLLSTFGVRLLRHRYYKFLSDKENYPELLRQNGNGNRNEVLIFDIGANIGDSAIAFRKQFPSAIIHSFEPFQAIFEHLERNTRKFDIHCHRLALGSEIGDRTVRRESASPYFRENSTLKQPDSATPQDLIETIHLATLDAFCEQNGIQRIDILKTDTEGSDLQVIQGASKLLTNGSVLNVVSEVTLSSSDNAHTNFFALIDWLRQYGFAPYSIYDVCHDAAGQVLYFNSLFKRNEDHWKRV
jgi:FkbM family methyltransferase